eukprot:9195060-Karenia_brevis.AAC.1
MLHVVQEHLLTVAPSLQNRRNPHPSAIDSKNPHHNSKACARKDPEMTPVATVSRPLPPALN